VGNNGTRPARWRSWLRPFVPPVAAALVGRLRGRPDAIRFVGDFPSWDAARRASTGYDDGAILARVRESALKVRSGQAAFERDGVAFDRPDFNFPLLACLLRVATESGNRLRVFDFGGSLGSTYHQCRPFLSGVGEVCWTVVEQPAFVECGRREFEDGRLQFRDSLDAVSGPVDAILLSSVLQYLAEPFAVLDRLTATGAQWLIVDRALLIQTDRDALTVQHVPESIYGAPVSYPAWLLSRSRLLTRLGSDWELVCEARGFDGPFPRPGGEVSGSLWLFRTRRAAT
jgi:putative methyltransferase (TIGR04325 family)